MRASLVFEFPLAWQVGLPLVLLAIALMLGSFRKLALAKSQKLALVLLRTLVLAALILLVARPVWIPREKPAATQRSVALLVDRSESMSIEENGSTRYQQALEFLRGLLLPALQSAGLPVQSWLFAEEVEAADGKRLAAAKPDGRKTDLGGAIARVLSDAPTPPLALIVLTDGIANETASQTRALSLLAATRTPVMGIGFGSDLGARTLSLRDVEAPTMVAPNARFDISAQMELVNASAASPFDLLLFSDERLIQKKTIQTGTGTRTWIESFQLLETNQGLHRYTIQCLPPSVPGLKCVNTLGSATVQVQEEKELRVLYVQGALTWDYKFIRQALHPDPAIKITGLTRTSSQSIFRQNVESAGELLSGFPTKLEELAPFRVVVLSNLKPIDLTPGQQDLLARFCSELGGGVLMIGGPATFDSSWQGSRLEQLLPVVFASNPGVLGLDRPFRLQLTEEALQHPVFQIADRRPAREVWASLPAFSQYGRVDAAKPGAQVWARHLTDDGPSGKRILMAAQRYGAGLSSVICLQNFWRWRLARESSPPEFDRFWQQFFRFLSEANRPEVTIHLADQDLHPAMDVRVVLECRPNPKTTAGANQQFRLKVEKNDSTTVAEQTLELPPARPVNFSFRAEKAGVYTLAIQNLQQQTISQRTLEIRDVNREFQNTGRNLEILRQWAALSGGLAVKAEDCRDAADLLAHIKNRWEQNHQAAPLREPWGLNRWMLAVLVLGLSSEWVLRKQWNLL